MFSVPKVRQNGSVVYFNFSRNLCGTRGGSRHGLFGKMPKVSSMLLFVAGERTGAQGEAKYMRNVNVFCAMGTGGVGIMREFGIVGMGES